MDGINLESLSVGWAFIGAVLCINVLSSIGKKIAKMAKAGESVRWGVAHVLPVALAVGISFIPEMKVEGIEGFASRLVFFIGVGGTASWWYRIVKAALNFVLRKLGADSIPPSEKPPA